jgi:hypothetical protein
MLASIRKADANTTAMPSLPKWERVTPASKLVYNKEILRAHYGLGLSLPAAQDSMCLTSRALYALCLVCSKRSTP